MGKKVAGDFYIHRMFVNRLSDEIISLFQSAKQKLSIEQDRVWNLVKINSRKKRVSFLVYPSFDIEAHPELKMSISINLCNTPPSVRVTKGGGRILHRKELFVDSDYPNHEKFLQLTKEEEKLGLLDTQVFFKGKKLGTVIGNKQIWEEWLEYNFIRIEDHCIIKKSKGEKISGI